MKLSEWSDEEWTRGEKAMPKLSAARVELPKVIGASGAKELDFFAERTVEGERVLIASDLGLWDFQMVEGLPAYQGTLWSWDRVGGVELRVRKPTIVEGAGGKVLWQLTLAAPPFDSKELDRPPDHLLDFARTCLTLCADATRRDAGIGAQRPAAVSSGSNAR
ncbi:MAG: hypothetical protein AABM41_03380 [Chloroflexota bacterium]